MSKPNPLDFRVLPIPDTDLIPFYIGSDTSKPFWVKWGDLKKVIESLSPPAPPGSAAWGSILTGTGVASQTDLVTYLNNNYYPLSSNPASYVTASQLTTALLSYVTTSALATALLGYVPISRTITINGVTFDLSADRSWTVSGGGSVNSVNSGININVDNTDPANPIINSLSDRYKTTSTTSNSVSNGSKSFTVDINLSYIPLQEILVVFDASNHMHGEVTSYNPATGALVVDIKSHTGSGTYTAWTLNLDGTPVDALTGSGTVNQVAYFTAARVLASLTNTMSIKIVGGNIELDGDEVSPGPNKYYGTNGSGNRGYHILNQVPVPYIYTRKVYSLFGTYMTSMAYYNNLLYFASFFIGGGTGGTQIYNATTAAFNSTSTFTQTLYNRIVNNGGTDEVWVISQAQTFIQRLNASSGIFIANSSLTGVITTAINTRFAQFSSTKVFQANATNYFVVNPLTFVTTSLTAHGLGNIPYVSVNNNPSSPQNGLVMMGGPNGIILINGTTNAIALAATTVSGNIGAVYDVQYDTTNDVWIVLTVISSTLRIVYLKPATSTTFTVPTTVNGVSAMGSSFAAGAAIYGRLLLDEANNYLFLYANSRLTQLTLTTGDIIQSMPIQSASPAVTSGAFSAADIDLVNKRVFAASGLNTGAGVFIVNEIMYS